MILTFVVELVFIIYTVWRYKLNNIARLVVAILASLAVFQLVEYQICGGVSGNAYARAGFIAISLLPPLGLHLASEISGRKNRYLIGSAYASAAGFIAFFAFFGHSIAGQICGGNYIIFELAPGSQSLYTLYYYGWLLAGTYLSWRWSQQATKDKTKQALRALSAGYVVFILPTTAVNIIDPSTIKAIPSIMCGFAVLLGFVLVFWVMPIAGKLKESGRSILRYTK